ncbi:MAG: aspartate aminotransferase family protein [Woeseiaceae bacterium]|nr:aspartate aminotransferase family protein [Woeseiaceae bacterium]
MTLPINAPAESRASSVFYREPLHDYPRIVHSEGVYLRDSEGRQYLDGSGGAAVSAVGHGHPRVIAAVQDQLARCAFAHTLFFTNEPQEQLADILRQRFGDPAARVYFVSGGSEANETALKLARQYWVARGVASKHLFVSRRRSYHGNTLGALALSGNPGRRALYAPLLADWPKVDDCYAYREQGDGETDADYAERAAASLDTAIATHGAENIAAFVAETVVGATLGVVPPAGDYLARIRAICDRHDILLILDEVMAGSGRCGRHFAFEDDGIRPDIVTLGKGLTGGYQPLGATIASGAVHDTVVAAHGAFAHGHTWVGHATACAAGVAVAGVVDDERLLENARAVGTELRRELRAALRDHPHVGDVRGRGLFTGIELVVDRDTRTPPPGALGLPARLRQQAMDNGLVCYPGGGGVDGRNGAHILLAPPLIYQLTHVDELVSRLLRTLDGLAIPDVAPNNPEAIA